MQNYNTVASRNLIMAEREMLAHAEPIKVISTFGAQKAVPKNKTDTVVFRRALPIDANGTTGSPSGIAVTDYLLQEGVTPAARSIVYQDVQCTLQQFGVLMKLSSKAESLYEDDIPKDMTALVGEHMGSIEELISYGVVRGGTNVVYGNGTTRVSTNTPISISRLRQCARVIENGHGKKVTEKLKSGVNFGSESISSAYLVFVHTDLEADIRNLPGFKEIVDYGSAKAVHEREIGAVEGFRFISSPYFRPFLLAATSATGTTAGTVLANGVPNSSNAPDIYPIVVIAKEAWGQVALKGMDAIDPVYLPASVKSHANPLGQFGYVGAQFWKTAVRLNEAWMCRLEVAASAL
jgi:N4-gp56 family major capsid protein